MKFFIVLLSFAFLVQGTPLKPPVGTTDKLEAFPWIKESKAAKAARFGTTPSTRTSLATEAPQTVAQPQSPQLALTNQQLQDYIAALTASLQPYVVDDQTDTNDTPTAPTPPASAQTLLGSKGAAATKRPLKGKVPKQVDAQDEPTTESYWEAEKKLYPDSFYDEFYLDWLRKRQIEEATANPSELVESANEEPALPPSPQLAPPAPAMPPAQQQPFPTVPLSYNPYLINPFLYPFAGMKVSKAMAQAQVNAALTAMNITTTPKPLITKIKLKIPIPVGGDLAQVVSSGIAGFPAGTTYELSKKK